MSAWENPDDLTRPWSEVASTLGFDETVDTTSVVIFDYQDDGDLDALVSLRYGPPRLYENNASADGNLSATRWLRILALEPCIGDSESTGTRTCLSGTGTVITVTDSAGKTQTSQQGTLTHHFAQSEATVHFGIPAAGASKRSVDQLSVLCVYVRIFLFIDVLRTVLFWHYCVRLMPTSL